MAEWEAPRAWGQPMIANYNEALRYFAPFQITSYDFNTREVLAPALLHQVGLDVAELNQLFLARDLQAPTVGIALGTMPNPAPTMVLPAVFDLTAIGGLALESSSAEPSNF